MPTPLEQRLSAYNEKLLELYIQDEHDEALLTTLRQIKEYYNRSFYKSTYNQEAILASYQLFIDNLSDVNEGILTSEDALKQIEKNTYSRKLGIVFYNIAKSLEAAYWAVATCAFGLLFFSASTLTAPNVLLAVAALLVSGALFVKTAEHFSSSMNEYKSFETVNEEDARERNAVSFFSSATAISNEEGETLELTSQYEY